PPHHSRNGKTMPRTPIPTRKCRKVFIICFWMSLSCMLSLPRRVEMPARHSGCGSPNEYVSDMSTAQRDDEVKGVREKGRGGGAVARAFWGRPWGAGVPG